MSIFGILGLVMIDSSGPHIAGATRTGKITLTLLGAPAIKADIFPHGSLVRTHKGRGTGKTLTAGIMGVTTGDSRIRIASELIKKQGPKVTTTIGNIDDAHPNTARVTLIDASGKTVSLLDSSIGGGNILVEEVSGVEVSITGQHTTLIIFHRNAPGTIVTVTEVITDTGVNICNFRLSRQRKSGEAVMTTKINGNFGPELDERIRILPNTFSGIVLRPI